MKRTGSKQTMGMARQTATNRRLTGKANKGTAAPRLFAPMYLAAAMKAARKK